MTTDTASAPDEFKTDRDGFPVEECRRCSGVGRIPAYGNVHGGVCFGCSGSGWIYPRGKTAQLAAGFRQWCDAQRYVSAGAFVTVSPTGAEWDYPIKVGDLIREHGRRGSTPPPWREVVAVRRTCQISGWGSTGDGAGNMVMRSMVLRIVITFADGSTHNGFGERWTRLIDPALRGAMRAEAVDAAVAAYRKTLARRNGKR
jgi:hypothetical protein